MCGLAGALLANNTDFISPAVMYWTRSGDLMVMVILGGMGSLFGPVVGAIVYLVLEEFLSQVTEYWAMIMGPLLLLVVLFGRGGIMGVLGRFSVAEPLLRVENLVRRFGGIVATDNLSLDVAQGELHAIIGPNGAGKTTLISQLIGQLHAELRRHPLCRPATSPACRPGSPQRARAGAFVPDHLAAAGLHRGRQCRAGGAGP